MNEKFVLFLGNHPREQFIVCRKPPFYIGRLFLFENNLQYAEFTNSSSGTLAYAQVYPYRIVVALQGSLGGRLFAHPLMRQELTALMEQMARFYLEEMVKVEPGRFKKYLL